MTPQQSYFPNLITFCKPNNLKLALDILQIAFSNYAFIVANIIGLNIITNGFQSSLVMKNIHNVDN